MPIYRVTVVDDQGNPVPNFHVEHRRGCIEGCTLPPDASNTDEDGTTDKITVRDFGHRIAWDAQAGFMAGTAGSDLVDLAQRVIVTITLQPIPEEEAEEEAGEDEVVMEADVQSHLCGADCKTKDTPCARRVLEGDYCYQHRGAA